MSHRDGVSPLNGPDGANKRTWNLAAFGGPDSTLVMLVGGQEITISFIPNQTVVRCVDAPAQPNAPLAMLPPPPQAVLCAPGAAFSVGGAARCRAGVKSDSIH
jgi:hypothetical protein